MKYASGEKPRVGDVVECVEVIDATELIKNGIYEVIKTHPDFDSVIVFGTYRTFEKQISISWYAKRFVFIGRID